VSGAAGLLAEIRAAGAEVVLDGAVLRIKVPHGTLTEAQRRRLIEHRAAIATLLAGPTNHRNAPQGDAVDARLADRIATFDERAAISEIDGGLDRNAAERIARAEVAHGPAGETVADWRAWMRRRLSVRLAWGLSPTEARRSVWSEAEDEWHRRHDAAPNPDRCAGCGEWMLDGPGMRFNDGAVVHFGNPDRLDCLILYGEAWRGAASVGLVALGLKRPAGQP
jgi:hypothetical protein